VNVYCTSQSQISLRLGIYDPNKNFHRILSSEQVCQVCSDQLRKNITINHATNGD